MRISRAKRRSVARVRSPTRAHARELRSVVAFPWGGARALPAGTRTRRTQQAPSQAQSTPLGQRAPACCGVAWRGGEGGRGDGVHEEQHYFCVRSRLDTAFSACFRVSYWPHDRLDRTPCQSSLETIQNLKQSFPKGGTRLSFSSEAVRRRCAAVWTAFAPVGLRLLRLPWPPGQPRAWRLGQRGSQGWWRCAAAVRGAGSKEPRCCMLPARAEPPPGGPGGAQRLRARLQALAQPDETLSDAARRAAQARRCGEAAARRHEAAVADECARTADAPREPRSGVAGDSASLSIASDDV